MESGEKGSIGTIIRGAGRRIKAAVKAFNVEPREPEVNESPLKDVLPKEDDYPPKKSI